MFKILVFWILSFSVSSNAIVRTNSNEVTDFYDKNLESKNDFFDSYHSENNRAVESIKAGSNHEMLEGYAECDSKAAHLSDIRAVELEGQGRHARNSEEYRFYDENELEPNWSKAGNRMHKDDADEIASATAHLFTDLMDKLRELGLADCKSVKGDKVKEPIYMIYIKREPQRNTEYDQFFCEEPRNRYSCRKWLKMRCSDGGSVVGKLSHVTGNMTHYVRDNMLYIGVNREAYFYNNWGAQHDFKFTFNISAKDGIDEFKLQKIDWADYVLVKLNGKVIYQSPGVNRKIQMSQNPSHYRRGPDGARYYGVDIGASDYVPANTRRYYTQTPNIEAKKYLKDGLNTLDIRLVYGNGGKLWLKLRHTEKICNAWSETWEEVCNLSN